MLQKNSPTRAGNERERTQQSSLKVKVKEQRRRRSTNSEHVVITGNCKQQKNRSPERTNYSQRQQRRYSRPRHKRSDFVEKRRRHIRRRSRSHSPTSTARHERVRRRSASPPPRRRRPIIITPRVHDRRKGRGDRDGRYPSGSLVKVKKDPEQSKPTIKPKSEAANGADRLDGKGKNETNKKKSRWTAPAPIPPGRGPPSASLHTSPQPTRSSPNKQSKDQLDRSSRSPIQKFNHNVVFRPRNPMFPRPFLTNTHNLIECTC